MEVDTETVPTKQTCQPGVQSMGKGKGQPVGFISEFQMYTGKIATEVEINPRYIEGSFGTNGKFRWKIHKVFIANKNFIGKYTNTE